jgi:hypothetical protein
MFAILFRMRADVYVGQVWVVEHSFDHSPSQQVTSRL